MVADHPSPSRVADVSSVPGGAVSKVTTCPVSISAMRIAPLHPSDVVSHTWAPTVSPVEVLSVTLLWLVTLATVAEIDATVTDGAAFSVPSGLLNDRTADDGLALRLVG